MKDATDEIPVSMSYGMFLTFKDPFVTVLLMSLVYCFLL